MANGIKIENGIQTEYGLIVPEKYQNVIEQWGKGLFTTSYEAMCAMLEANKWQPLFYHTAEDWSIKGLSLEYLEKLKTYIETFYIPHLMPNNRMLEIGCAAGEWTFFMAPYVKQIIAYDYSSSLIKEAKQKNKSEFPNTTNIAFLEGDICKMDIQETYDCISCMGVFSCILDFEEVKRSVKKLYDSLCGGGGIMLYKENTNASMEDHFFFGRRTDYWMVSRSRSKYIALFKEIGFQILEEQVIYHREEQIGSTQKELETFMCILKKG